MTHKRYRLSFLLSTLISFIIGMGIFSLLDIEKKLQAPKKEHLVKVALLTLPKPVKKVIPKPIEPKKVMLPTPPIIKKPKPKPIVKPKKIIKKHKPKKVHRKVIKKHTPKKIIKRAIKKHKPKLPKVHKKIIKKYRPKPKQVFKEVTVPHYIIEVPKHIRTQPKVIKTKPIHKTSTPIDNGRAKRAFLEKIRHKIIANKKYPRIALRRHIESDVKVRFDVTTTGQVSNIRFISGKRVFYKSIRETLSRTFPVAIPSNMRETLPISDVSVVLHFNIR